MSAPRPVFREAVPDASLAATLTPAAAAAITAPRTDTDVRAWLLTATLFFLPLLTYWPATFHDYGLRDDYSNLREAHEEPATVIRFCASHARPLYGWLLQATYGQTSSVQNLEWMRCFAALLLGALAVVMLRGLIALGWSEGSARVFAAALVLLPSAQVIAGWAVGWPYAATALLSVAGFFSVEVALTRAPGGFGRTVGHWSMAMGLMVVSALIYQPSALFYAVPLAAALIAQRTRSVKQTARWLGCHVGFVMVALGLAYAIMTLLYARGVFVKSGRIAFEQHWPGKIAWFLQEALPNGLSMFVLNDNNLRNHGWYLGGAAVAGALLLAGLRAEWRRHGRGRALIWAAGLFGLPVFAFSVSLLASERYATYRTIFAMSAVLLCFLLASVRALTADWAPAGRRLLAALVLTGGFFAARHHVYALIAVPQGHEWQIIMDGARRVRLDAPARPRIFAIASNPNDISTALIYHDEFGSLSSNSEWVPKEMFKRAMHDLHPEVSNLESRYAFSEGYKLPSGQHFDVIIDMHQLRRFYTEN